MKKLKQLLLILVLSLSLTSPAVIPAMGTTTVSAATVRKPSLSNSKLTIYTGKSVLLKVNGTSGKVKWISQNKRIVTVDSKGKVTARGVGKTIIFAKTGNYTLRCQITVKKENSLPGLRFSLPCGSSYRKKISSNSKLWKYESKSSA